MKEDNKFHVFHQETPDEKLFTYNGAKYTKSEVNIMIKLLPKDHKHVVIQWVKPKSTNPAYVPYERKKPTN